MSSGTGSSWTSPVHGSRLVLGIQWHPELLGVLEQTRQAMPINSVFKSWDQVDGYLDKIQRKMLEPAD